jgi:hypothetical protein
MARVLAQGSSALLAAQSPVVRVVSSAEGVPVRPAEAPARVLQVRVSLAGPQEVSLAWGLLREPEQAQEVRARRRRP